MKSIHHGKAGANAKLNGKKTCTLSCGCCSLQNFTESERIKEADKEILEFISVQARLEPEMEQVLQDNLWDLYARDGDERG